jgi:hypothetical protein
MGVILEDDCLPNTSFFKFCEILLKRFYYNKKIYTISGSNFQNKITTYNDYYFTNFLYDRIGYLFKDMIINGLSYKYSNAMVEENNIDVILFEIFPINEEEFLLYIYNQPLDDKWVSHVRYKESQKEIIITSLLKGASELTDLLLIEKVENYQQSGVIVRKTYFDDENNTQKFFENSTMFKMMQNYVTTISSGFF